jgi:class 3 adenylate cyclase
MLNAYFERLIPLMEEAGGEVHQIVGDQLMVVFNKQGDLPDHALRAAGASLALQEEAKAIASEHPEWPRFRVGVNSGEVLAGVVGAQRGHRKHGVVGDVVNVAARLEADAPVDSVLIGDGTYRALGDRALVLSLPPQRVKGKAEPVIAYVLLSLRPESGGTSP